MIKQNEINVSKNNVKENYKIPMMEICCFDIIEIVTTSFGSPQHTDESEALGW